MFHFEHLPPGNYQLKYTLSGYLGSNVKRALLVTIKPGAVTESIALDLSPTARIEGTVFDEDGQPMPGVSVYTNFALRATTNQDGRYAIEQLESGSYRIALRTPSELRRKTLKHDPETGETFGYANTEYYPGTADPQAASPVAVAGGLELHAFDIRLRRVRLVEFSGRLVERAGGEPLTDARVELVAGGATFLDDSFKERKVGDDGSFRFDLIQPAPCSLLVYRGTSNKALPYTVPVELGKAGIQDLKIAVPPFPTISGSVIVPPATDWAGQVMISVRHTTMLSTSRDFNVTSDKFTIDDLPPGRWSLEVESNAVKRPNFEKLFIKSSTFGTQSTITTPLTITESGNPPLEIQLTAESGKISGFAYGADGTPLKRAMILIGKAMPKEIVTVRDMAGMMMRPGAYTKEDGSFTTDALAPGMYRIMASGDGRISFRDALQVEVKPGETTQIRLTMPKP